MARRKYEFVGAPVRVMDVPAVRHAPAVRFRLGEEYTDAQLENMHVRMIRRISDGAVGGWIESTYNLAHSGSCWVDDNALVVGRARVADDARVCDFAVVFGAARVLDNAVVAGNAVVSHTARVFGDAHVRENAWVRENGRVAGYTQVGGQAVVGRNAYVIGATQLSGSVRVFNARLIDFDISGDYLVTTVQRVVGWSPAADIQKLRITAQPLFAAQPLIPPEAFAQAPEDKAVAPRFGTAHRRPRRISRKRGTPDGC